jgi:Questin oxidase-like
MGTELDEAYARLHHTGPEFEGWLSSHGPMVVEALIRRGHDSLVTDWLDQYVRRLEDLPGESEPITDASWPTALGNARRIGDWTAYLLRGSGEQPWRELLALWWPRLIPGIAAGATHGVIRVGHAVENLLTGNEQPESINELAHGIAYWAARCQHIPHAAQPTGHRHTDTALSQVPRVADQSGGIRERLAQLDTLTGWPASLRSLKRVDTAAATRTRLEELTTAATLRYLRFGHGNGVMMVHSATAPRAVLRVLPALPQQLWPASADAAWFASAAITSAYAPRTPAPDQTLHRTTSSAQDVFARAAEHRDEHVIKFTDTALDIYARTGNPDALVAAQHAQQLIPAKS